MFWAVGLEIDVPQTNPTTRDRLPLSVKREMLVVVHLNDSIASADMHSGGQAIVKRVVRPIHRILPDTISFKPAAEMNSLLLLLLLLHRKHPMWPSLGLSGTVATGAT